MATAAGTGRLTVAVWQLACAWAGVLMITAGCWLLRQRLALVSLGMAWCLVAFLPMSNLLAFRNGPYGDYYLTLPSLGVALLFGWFVGERAVRSWSGMGGRLLLLVLVFWRLAAMGESLSWSMAWNDPAKILQRTIQTFPQAFGAMNEYARLRYFAGDYEACQAWTDQALVVAPRCLGAYELRALVAERRGNVDLAWNEIERFQQYGGAGQSWGWYFKGFLLDEHMRDTNGAIRCYQRAVAGRMFWSSDVLDSMNALAYFAVQRGDRRTAIDLWEQVVRADPGRLQVRQNLVRAYLEVGDRERAQQQLEIVQKELHGNQR